jgi:hypothetical protein
MIPLNEYEAQQADEIAAWKSERPSLVMTAFRRLSQPLTRAAARVMPASAFQSVVLKADQMSQKFGGPAEIARKAGVKDVTELRTWPLEECDRLADDISAPAEREALIEGMIAGLGGIVTETMNLPVLLTAALRSVYRIGHCYGFPLDREDDRRFVLGILELSSVDDPARRQVVFEMIQHLDSGSRSPRRAKEQPWLDALREDLLEDLAFGAVPVLGDLTSVLMDYDFMHRVDITARRVCQERWLRDRGKLDEVHPAPVSRRRSSIKGGIDIVAQFAYLGSYGIAFGLTLPLAAVASGAAGLDNRLTLGLKQGALQATADSNRFLKRLRSDLAAAGLEVLRPSLESRPAIGEVRS